MGFTASQMNGMAVVRMKSESSSFKGIVHTKMKILSIFALVCTLFRGCMVYTHYKLSYYAKN